MSQCSSRQVVTAIRDFASDEDLVNGMATKEIVDPNTDIPSMDIKSDMLSLMVVQSEV